MRAENGNKEACHRLQTKQAEGRIKQQALIKYDSNLILHIGDVDLTAKNFKCIGVVAVIKQEKK